MGNADGTWDAYWQDKDLTLVCPTCQQDKKTAEVVLHRLILGYESKKRHFRELDWRYAIPNMSDEELMEAEEALQLEFIKRNFQGPSINPRLKEMWME